MDPKVVKRLVTFNQELYENFAVQFSESRSSERLNIAPIMPYLRDDITLLDVGCGNGRLAVRLETEGFRIKYVGVDFASGLIEIAKAASARFKNVTAQFELGDLTKLGWLDCIKPSAPYDLVVSLAVFHHIPSFDLRRRLLSEVRSLLRPGGFMVMSNWEFSTNPRLRGKIVPWKNVGIDKKDLEEGDFLLDWKRGGAGHRYVHLIGEDEMRSLAEATGFEEVQQFRADSDLNLYSILRA